MGCHASKEAKELADEAVKYDDVKAQIVQEKAQIVQEQKAEGETTDDDSSSSEHDVDAADSKALSPPPESQEAKVADEAVKRDEATAHIVQEQKAEGETTNNDGVLKAADEHDGDAADSKAASVPHENAKPPTAASGRMEWLLDLLGADAASTPTPALPISPHAERLPSGLRGVSLGALRGLCNWLQQHGDAHLRPMAFVNCDEGFAQSVCALTAHTGLSLVESLVQVAEREGIAHDDLFGRGDNFFSYSWDGSTPAALYEAVESALGEQAAEGVSGPRFTWIDILTASQNLLGGRYRDPAVTEEDDPEGHAAREEDVNGMIAGALEAASELFFFAAPLLGSWEAPPHPMLVPDRETPAAPWQRRGPYPMTRGWCLYELAKGLEVGLKLRVVLSADDRAGFEKMLVKSFGEIATVLSEVDARTAQLTKAADRQYILPQIEELPNGLGSVTKTAQAALREWLARAGKEALERLPASERGTSALLLNLGTLLNDQGDDSGAELLQREAMEARLEAFGDMHPDTILAMNNLGLTLEAKRDYEGAEPLLRGALKGNRALKGDTHPHTLAVMNNLGMLLKGRGDLDEASPLLREALETRRETLGDMHRDTLTSVQSLGLLLEEQDNLEGAQMLLQEALEGRRETIGDKHPDTLQTMYHLGMLHVAKRDADEASPLLREALEGRRETLGDTHPATLQSTFNMAMLLKVTGDFEGAADLFREELLIYHKRKYEATHPKVLDAIFHLGMVHVAMRNLDEAESYLSEALRGRLETLGEEHPDTVETIFHTGMVRRAQGDNEGAVPLLRAEVDMCARQLGINHKRTQSSVMALVSSLMRIGCGQEAMHLAMRFNVRL